MDDDYAVINGFDLDGVLGSLALRIGEGYQFVTAYAVYVPRSPIMSAAGGPAGAGEHRVQHFYVVKRPKEFSTRNS